MNYHFIATKPLQPRFISMEHRIYLTSAQDARISQRRKSVAVVDSLVVLAGKHVHEH
jgi:hypothetical protein